MTRENIEGMREVILPFVKKKLLETNYENLGKSDAEEFEKHFNEICDLALKALEQEPVLDKIRAEIKQYQSDYDVHGTEYDRTAWKAFNRSLQIIDKYKGESEQ